MLKILPPNISNLIAAGEVVQRPSSVVKELLENAIDAGAASVSVIIEDAGKTLIQVIDDGCGMTPEEARLCFERHATSKIAQASDLDPRPEPRQSSLPPALSPRRRRPCPREPI